MRENKVILSDAELIEKCESWIKDLCTSGGQKWSLTVPVDFNKDPDMLFIELINRFKQQLINPKLICTIGL